MKGIQSDLTEFRCGIRYILGELVYRVAEIARSCRDLPLGREVFAVMTAALITTL